MDGEMIDHLLDRACSGDFDGRHRLAPLEHRAGGARGNVLALARRLARARADEVRAVCRAFAAVNDPCARVTVIGAMRPSGFPDYPS
jgi:hypothetical protein